MGSAEKSAKPNKKIKENQRRVNVVPKALEGAWNLDNRSRRNNGSLTNNDDSVGTIE